MYTPVFSQGIGKVRMRIYEATCACPMFEEDYSGIVN